MTLKAGEVNSGGFVRDENGYLVCVAEGAVNSGGFMRDSDGRIVIVGNPNFSSGDIGGIYVSGQEGVDLSIKHGTAAAPVTIGRPTFKVSRTEAVQSATIEETGGEHAAGEELLGAIAGFSKGSPTSQVQSVGVYGGAENTSTYAGEAFNNPDACGVYGIGIIREGTAAKATAIGVCGTARREVSTADATAAQFAMHNRGAAGTYNASGGSTTVGVWVVALGTQDSGCAVNLVNPYEKKYKVGLGVPSLNGGLISDSTYRDDGEAKRSIDIRGKHSEGAITVGAEAGFVVLGAEALTTTTTQRLEINSGATNSNPALKLTASANTTHTILFNNTSAGFTLGQAGGTNALMTGTAAGDGCIIVGNSATLHVGKSAATAMLKVTGEKVSLFGVAPVVRAAAITEPAAELASLKTAVNSVRTALKNIGITE